jgi:transposase
MESWQNVSWQNSIQTKKRQKAPVMGLTQGARRATGVNPITGKSDRLDPEVSEMKTRRRFTAKYKLMILQQADACTEAGQIGALLRREGLYFSNITTWRKQRSEGLLNAMKSKKRGRKAKEQNPLRPKVAELEKENERLKRRLTEAHTIIEVQKKLSEMLEIFPDDQETSGKDF